MVAILEICKLDSEYAIFQLLDSAYQNTPNRYLETFSSQKCLYLLK